MGLIPACACEHDRRKGGGKLDRLERGVRRRRGGGEQREDEERNILVFSDKGRMIDDKLLNRLTWAPILPVPKNATDS